MCGILLSFDSSEKRLSSISHRGIENTVIQCNNVFLCHHRLPIQTRDGDNWNQPREISPGVYLMFNGEIFNYDTASYTSDTEYLCELFSRHDFSSINSFQFFSGSFIPHIASWDGFWSIVIYNSNTGDIISFTDPLGKKCLYYNNLGEIASEVKGVVNSDSKIDHTLISEVRKWGYNVNDRTSYDNVSRFLPNTIYSYNINSPQFKTEYKNYYKGFETGISELKDASYEDHMEWLWNKMFESIKNRLVSKDYPISALISGGLDSSIIAAVLKQIGADVRWYSIENGESEFVELLSSHLDEKATYLDYSMDPDKLNEIYSKWNESPIDLGSVIPQYHLFEAIRKDSDYRIVLSGDGADELFGGYKRIHEYDSQKSDIFNELTYYHLPRLDKMSMAHTLELRNPFLHLDIVSFALTLPLEWRTDKKILKDTFGPLLPEEIVYRKKAPLKNPSIKEDKLKYRQQVVDLFLDK